MTEEDAAKVKVGDLIYTKVGRRFVTVRVAKITLLGGGNYPNTTYRLFHFYPLGSKEKDRFDNPLPMKSVRPSMMRLAHDHECSKDPVQCNVMADWLDDNGHPKAAKALREAFPIAKPQED